MMPTYYWETHRKAVIDGRLAWFAEAADETFWSAHWQARLTAKYFRDAEDVVLHSDELGAILGRVLPRAGRHIEAGCGAGYWVAALCKNGYKVEGIEYAASLVKLVNAVRADLPIRCGDALAIDAPTNTYASYLSFGVVEHREAGPGPFFSEARRVLTTHGLMVVSVPLFGKLRNFKRVCGAYEGMRPALPLFQYGFAESEVCGLLRAHGFAIQEVHRLYAHRLLMEEVPLYRRLASGRGGRYIKAVAKQCLGGVDGHMLVVVARRD